MIKLENVTCGYDNNIEERINKLERVVRRLEESINRIENKKMLPSMTVFFYICDFFRITPKEFFSFESTSDLDVIHAMKKLSALDEKKKEHVIAIIEDLSP